MGFGVRADLFMRGAKALQQRIAQIASCIRVVNILDGFDGEAAGLLAPLIPAHAVGNQGESALFQEVGVAVRFPIREKVFVILALAADIRQAGHLDSRPNPHHASLEGICSAPQTHTGAEHSRSRTNAMAGEQDASSETPAGSPIIYPMPSPGALGKPARLPQHAPSRLSQPFRKSDLASLS